MKIDDKVLVTHTDYAEIPVGTTTHIVDVDGKDADLWSEKYPEGLRFYGWEFELTAPTLTIQAGRYYKTRDGRKVGPMVRGSGGGSREYSWTAPQRVGDFVTSWTAEGLYHVGDRRPEIAACDLIAEWVDEPVAAWKTANVGDNVVVRAEGRWHAGKTVKVTSVDYEDTAMRLRATDGEYDLWLMNDDVVSVVTGANPVAVAPATATFKAGDRVRRPGHLTGTVLDVDGNNVRIDYGADWGEYTFTVPELELVEAAATPATIKVGDWVRTDAGDIGIVLHDDGTNMVQFKVGFVGDENDAHWDWFSDLQLTIVPPGTAKAANDNSALLAEIDELEQRLSDLRAHAAA